MMTPELFVSLLLLLLLLLLPRQFARPPTGIRNWTREIICRNSTVASGQIIGGQT